LESPAAGAPEELGLKVPTADLELLLPQYPDEAAFGVTHEEFDDSLEGKPVRVEAIEAILWIYLSPKRAQARSPATPCPSPALRLSPKV
jgi:NAD+ synthase